MDRRDTAQRFRERLHDAMARGRVNRSALAASIGIDRSTLSQLLSPEADRLPRADTAAAIASALHVSLDWLLGLSQQPKLGADILNESVEVKVSANAPVDESLASWYAERVGYKIRHVPTTLPDLMKTEEVLAHEYRDFAARSPDRAIAISHGRLAYVRLPETDIEIAQSRQSMESFTRGEGIWRDLSLPARREQLDHMIALIDELYPTLRMFCFDGLTHFSVPYTVFGPQRAVVYVGQMFFAFNTLEHIRVLTRHFDAPGAGLDRIGPRGRRFPAHAAPGAGRGRLASRFRSSHQTGSLCALFDFNDIRRHGRTCSGHPRVVCAAESKNVDARIKSGHDG